MSLDLEVQQSLRRVMSLGGLSLAGAARGCNLSTATLSTYLRSTPEAVLYKGDLDGIQKRIATFTKRELERALAPQPPPFVETVISQEIAGVFRLSHVERVIGVVVGPPGVGKTATIEHYVQEMGDTISLSVNAMWDARAILVALCNSLGAQAKGSTWQIAERAIEALTGTGRLVIVDEAQFLKYPALETLRCIHDRARMGLVLCGMQRLYDNMMGKERGLYSHLFSRVTRCALISGDIDGMDVSRIAKSVFPDVTAREMEVFQTIANDPSGGRLRNLVQVLCHLKRTLTATSGKMTPDLIRDAGNLLMFRSAQN